MKHGTGNVFNDKNIKKEVGKRQMGGIVFT